MTSPSMPTIPKSLPRRTPTDDVLMDVARERQRQRDRFGLQSYPDTSETPTLVLDELEAKMLCIEAQQSGMLSWTHLLGEDVAEAISEAMAGRPDLLRDALIETAATCCAWVEALDRRKRLADALKRTK